MKIVLLSLLIICATLVTANSEPAPITAKRRGIYILLLFAGVFGVVIGVLKLMLVS